jgi:hypothetical protein
MVSASQAAAQAFDASVPDASVGEGGADRGSEENDPNGSPCADSRSCDTGFACQQGRCVPLPRNRGGCHSTPAVVAALSAYVLLRSRRFLRPRNDSVHSP